MSLSYVQVFFVDYGTVDTVETSKLRYLHENFAEHPAMCMRAKLSNIQPNGGEAWSESANNAFYLAYRNVDLEVEIVRKGKNVSILLWILRARR